MSGQHYSLRWNNYQRNMTSVFHELLQTEAFVDVTLACNDLSLKAHKVVLSACSSYFQKLLMENPCKHPTIIMPQDVCFGDLKFIIDFVYKGEIDVSQVQLEVSGIVFFFNLWRFLLFPRRLLYRVFQNNMLIKKGVVLGLILRKQSSYECMS
nr:unnamed protein product [Callosobruchus chinensis]